MSVYSHSVYHTCWLYSPQVPLVGNKAAADGCRRQRLKREMCFEFNLERFFSIHRGLFFFKRGSWSVDCFSPSEVGPMP